MFLSTWDHRYLAAETFHLWILHRTARQSSKRLMELHLQLPRPTRRRSRPWRALATEFLQQQHPSIPVRTIQLPPLESSHLRYQPQPQLQSQPQLQLRHLHMDRSPVLRLYCIQSLSHPHNSILSWPTSDRSGNPTLCILNSNSNSVGSRIQEFYLGAAAAAATAVLGPYPHIARLLE